MTDDKNKGGRPPAPPQLQRVNVPLRLPRWLVEWIDQQEGTRADVIEDDVRPARSLGEVFRLVVDGQVGAVLDAVFSETAVHRVYLGLFVGNERAQRAYAAAGLPIAVQIC